MLLPEEALRRHDEISKAMQEAARPAQDALKRLELSAGVQHVLRDLEEASQRSLPAMVELERQSSGARQALADFHARLERDLGEARQRSLPALVEFERQASDARQAFADFHARFEMPSIVETSRLFERARESLLGPRIFLDQSVSDSIRKAMEAMRVPWLDTENKLQSIIGFAELQGIGLAMQRFAPFDEKFTDQIRRDLGDWRAPLNFPKPIFEDVAARVTFYEGLGLNRQLTAFPEEAFDESAALAGLMQDIPAADPDEEAVFKRNNAAHDRLQRFEAHVRRFIDERMRAAFGDSWIKHRVHGDIRERWRDKKEKAVARGERELSLLMYADFMDYEPIITRDDNWKTVFEAYFRRKEFIRESFQRLHPVRNCTMHARPITSDDKVFLFFEIMRFLKAIEVI
jgi:hypothetical protein